MLVSIHTRLIVHADIRLTRACDRNETDDASHVCEPTPLRRGGIVCRPREDDVSRLAQQAEEIKTPSRQKNRRYSRVDADFGRESPRALAEERFVVARATRSIDSVSRPSDQPTDRSLDRSIET